MKVAQRTKLHKNQITGLRIPGTALAYFVYSFAATHQANNESNNTKNPVSPQKPRRRDCQSLGETLQHSGRYLGGDHGSIWGVHYSVPIRRVLVELLHFVGLLRRLVARRSPGHVLPRRRRDRSHGFRELSQSAECSAPSGRRHQHVPSAERTQVRPTCPKQERKGRTARLSSPRKWLSRQHAVSAGKNYNISNWGI